jgi:hypothetical protein
MISKAHNCIFVHIPKNAGQSIEHVFLVLNSLTWKTRAGLLLRPNNDPAAGPPRLAHLRARDYVRCGHVSQADFKRYYKFAIVRNPWERMVSFYKYLGEPKTESFNDFVINTFPRLWEEKYWFVCPQTDYVYDEQSKLLVDFVGRFERLQADFAIVCEKLGLSPMQVPFVNKSKERGFVGKLRRIFGAVGAATAPKRKYQEYYSKQTQDLVAEKYAADIANFGYRFSPVEESAPEFTGKAALAR